MSKNHFREGKMNGKVSVVITTRNRPEDIIRCLESVSFQLYLPGEVVIMNLSEIRGLKYNQNQFHVYTISSLNIDDLILIFKTIMILLCPKPVIGFLKYIKQSLF